MQAPIHIRWLIRSDMDTIEMIERETSAEPWTERDFVHTMRDRTTIGLVAELGSARAGYIVYTLHKRSIEVLRFAVDPLHRLRGVGTALIGRLKSKLKAQQRSQITLLVPERLLEAQLFLRGRGFRAVDSAQARHSGCYRMVYLLRDVEALAATANRRANNRISRYLRELP